MIEPQSTQETRESPPQSPPPGGLLFRYRNSLGVVLAILLVLSGLALPRARQPLQTWQLALGSALVPLGVALRLWCILQIGGSARKTSRLKANLIISWGPYSLVRNPIYIANATAFAGFATFSGLWWAPLLTLVLLGLWYDTIVRREEKFLLESFPEDYAAYRREARRWLPRLRYRGRPGEVPPYPFRRALKRERGFLIAVSIGLGLVLAFRLFVLPALRA